MEVMEAMAVAAACSFLLRRRCFGPLGPVLSCWKCKYVEGSAKRRAPGCVKRGLISVHITCVCCWLGCCRCCQCLSCCWWAGGGGGCMGGGMRAPYGSISIVPLACSGKREGVFTMQQY